MSLLGHDALGHWALGHPPDGATVTVLVVAPASYTVTANAVTFKLIESISPAAFVVSAQAVTEKQIEAVSAASFAVSANAVTARFLVPVAPAAYIVTANPTTEFENEVIAPAAFAVSFNNAPLVWTGAGIDTSYSGGVGHYLYEREQARQLAAITRTVPRPIDRRTMPRMAPLPRPYSAPIAPAPVAPAVQPDRMAAAAAQAQATKKRRDIEALLLLAS